jgi:hypothetical protein
MCALSFILMFVTAHIIAWSAMGGGWRGAARAPFVVFVPAAALLLLEGVMNEAYDGLAAKLGTLVAWELAYFFLYLCLRICARAVEPAQLAGPRK